MDTLALAKRPGFLRNQYIVRAVLKGGKLKDVAAEYQCTAANITKLMNRCFILVNGEYALTSALIPFQRLKEAERKAPLPTLQNKSGANSALRGLFSRLPMLKIDLDEMIIARLKDQSTAGPVSAAAFHGRFKFLLGEEKWPRDHYPYTTLDCAYESIRQYLLRRTDELKLERLGHKAQRQSYLLARKLHHPRVLDRIQIDSQDIDFRGRLDVLLNDQLIPLRLARANLYVARDVATDAALGYTFIYSEKPNRWDVLKLIAHCTHPWEPMDLTTPGLAYEPGACLPSGLPQKPTITFNTLELDNAWVHHAHLLESTLCERCATTLSFGRPKTPETRNWVEHAFDTLNRHVSHRIPSTTGSSVTDPIKESSNNQRQPPRFTWRMFEEAIDIELTSHNLKPQAGRLGGACPLNLFQEQVNNHWTPYVPSAHRSNLRPFQLSQIVEVKSRKGSVLRHINLDSVHYSCRTLSKLTIQNRLLEIRYDWRDLRQLQAYDMQGHYLGTLHAPRSWQSYPHSKATRAYINRLVKTERLHSKDVLAGTLYWLMQHSDQPKHATSLLRLYNEFASDQSLYIESTDAQRAKSNAPSPRQTTYKWTSQEAYHEFFDS